MTVTERIEDFINGMLSEIAEDSRVEYADILYDEYLEARYGSDPRWAGADWDELA